MNQYLIILNYNRAQSTIECIHSIEKYSDNRIFYIILIDNSSTDNSLEILSNTRFNSNTVIISTSTNLGFAGGVNYGIGYVQSNYSLESNDAIILINNDVILGNNAINQLYDFLDFNSDVSIVSPFIYNKNNRGEIWFCGGILQPFLGKAIHLNKYDYKKKDKINFISGCFMGIRISVFNTIGKFDELYFMYLEDIDFCYRANNATIKMAVIENAIVYHDSGESNKIFKYYYSIRNRLYLINKDANNLRKIIAKIYFVLVILVKMSVWFFLNRKYYKVALCSLKDYFNHNMHKGNGFRYLKYE
ncbi:MAG: glycosyltransferase family 2 protein [Bacteroidetes bacterium]|nr:glycosyltransferase family 2 protein [Bacteroidota bacterium]